MRLPTALLPAAAAAALTLAVVPSAHAAGTFNCDASALRLSVLGQAAIEPITANRSKTACANDAGPTSLNLAPVATVDALAARTLVSGAKDQQKALALGGVANLDVGTLSALPLPDLSVLIPDAAKTVTLNISSLAATANPILGLVGLTLPSTIDVGIGDALKDLLNPLPGTTLLHVGTVNAFAGGSCSNGLPVATGVPQVANVSILGQSINLDDVPTSIGAIDTQSLDLSKLDLSKIVLPKVITDLGLNVITQPVLTMVNQLVGTLIKALPPVQVPAALANVSLQVGKKTLEGTTTTQHGLDLHVSLLGQTILDGTIGEARMNTAGVDCSADTPAPTATTEALQCTTRKLVLTDVYESNGKVRLLGAADKKLAGRTVTIRFEGDNSTAAQTGINPDGSFSTTAPLPSKKLRSSNKARYVAIVGKERSLNLKLVRRMYVTKMTTADGKVTISGRVTRPLGNPLQPIKVQRRVSCSRNETVKTFLPKSDGTFKVTVAAPDGESAAVYRLATKVRKTTSNSKLFSTYTLPRGINLT